MRRSHQEVEILIQARMQDFIEGASSEVVFLASLKALGLDEDERKYRLWIAQVEKARNHGAR